MTERFNLKKTMTAVFLVAVLLISGCTAKTEPAREDDTGEEPVSSFSGIDKKVTVSTVDELLSAIGSGTEIELKAGIYDLTEASVYGGKATGNCSWEETYDGYQLNILGVENLTLTAQEGAEVSIVTRPRYSEVLHFEGCLGINLKNITFGHTEEPGYCTGGVLCFDKCSGVRAENCEMYGCGTLGMEAKNSNRITLDNCTVRDCTYGAVWAWCCYDVRIENSTIFNCASEKQRGIELFRADSCTYFAVVNCDIRDNWCVVLMDGEYSSEVFLLGCGISNCYCSEALFRCSAYSPVVDGCSFADNGRTYLYRTPEQSDLKPPVDLNGKELGWDEIEQMQRDTAVKYDGPVTADEPAGTEKAEPENETSVIKVQTVDEFLAAIGSDRTIIIDTPMLVLNTATRYGAYGSDSYYWMDYSDGPGLVIFNVKNLTIMTVEYEAEIFSVPRLADVIAFENCENIHLSGFTAGHTETGGPCSGGVLRFTGCSSVIIENCKLFGCGTLGIEATDSSDFIVSKTEIYDCSQGGASLFRCTNIEFSKCDIHDCEGPALYLPGSENVVFDGSLLGDGEYNIPKE